LTIASQLRCAAFALLAGFGATAAWAGPPYQTDDPEPTELHHREIYGFGTADARGSTLDGAAGFDLNYGPVKDVQLTATLPVAFSHAPDSGWRSGLGDVEIGVKYRFVNDEKSAVQAAIFPRVILPTSTHGLGRTRIGLLLPLWLQKDFGATSLFGGGGYLVNPGTGNRDVWQAGLAVTHQFNDKLSAGTEVTYQTRDTVDGSSTTGANIGLIRKLTSHAALLLAGGPSVSGGQASYHSYAALALYY
jgi:hypothetical protein